MSDFPPHGKYRIIARKLDGEPVATVREDGEDIPIKWERPETDNEGQLWYFEPLQGRTAATYYIRNVKYPHSYMEFRGPPEDKKGLVTRSAAYHWWEVNKLSESHSFSLKLADQSVSYWIGHGSVGGQLLLSSSGYLNVYFELEL